MLRWICALSLLCSCAREVPPEPLPPATRPEIRTVAVTAETMGTFTRAVALETTEEALLGDVARVEIDPGNGDILAADLQVTKAVYRFDRDGAFKLRYGRRGMGPGEYDSLIDFAVDADGTTVLLTTFKLMAFDRAGNLLRETRPDMRGLRILPFAGGYVVYGVHNLSQPGNLMWTFDHRLKPTGSRHAADRRLAKMAFIAAEPMAADARYAYLSDPFDPTINVYDPAGTLQGRYIMPNHNESLDTYWAAMTPALGAPAQHIGSRLHRLEYLHALDGRLHFVEINAAEGTIVSGMFAPDEGVVYRYSGSRFLLGPPDAPNLTMDTLCGSFEDTLIGALYAKEKVDAYRETYPVLKDIHMNDTDNPVLLFYRYNHRLDGMIGGL